MNIKPEYNPENFDLLWLNFNKLKEKCKELDSNMRLLKERMKKREDDYLIIVKTKNERIKELEEKIISSNEQRRLF